MTQSENQERDYAQEVRDADFWYGYIDEQQTALFLGVTERTIQNWRHRGEGPVYYEISSRCLRYRRIDLKAWADARVLTSTSDSITRQTDDAGSDIPSAPADPGLA